MSTLPLFDEPALADDGYQTGLFDPPWEEEGGGGRGAQATSPGPRLELFSRQPREGWTVWGNDPAVQQRPS